MSTRLFRMSILALALVATHAAAQTSISPVTRDATEALTAEQAAEVDAFIDLCTRRITGDPVDIKVVKSCRVMLISEYGGRNGAGYMRYFATALGAKFVSPALAKENSLIVLVNAAMAVAAVDQPEMAPSLARMLRHPNPAVRYYGAKGLAGASEAIVVRGATEADAMLTALVAAIQTEKVPSVVRALIQALDLTAVEGADPVVLAAAQGKARQALLGVLSRHMQAVRDGDVGMADAFGYAVQSLGTMGTQLPPQEQTALLQAMANVMSNAAKAYSDDAIQVDAKDRKRISAPPGEVSMLLVYCERAIGEITGQQDATVSRAIQSTPQETDVIKVQLRVNALVGTSDSPGTLNAAGVTAPVALPRTAMAGAGDAGPT